MLRLPGLTVAIHSAPPLITAPAGRHEAAILAGGNNSLTRTRANGIILATVLVELGSGKWPSIIGVFAMSIGRFCLLLAVVISFIVPSTARGITLGQVDTFEDGTAQGWFGPHTGTSAANGGGPAGSGDHYLFFEQLVASGLTPIQVLNQRVPALWSHKVGGIHPAVRATSQRIDRSRRLMFYRSS